MQILDLVLCRLSKRNTVIFAVENWFPEEPERCRTICKKKIIVTCVEEIGVNY